MKQAKKKILIGVKPLLIHFPTSMGNQEKPRFLPWGLGILLGEMKILMSFNQHVLSSVSATQTEQLIISRINYVIGEIIS